MKLILASALALSLLAAGSVSAHPIMHHAPHKVCTVSHHHRVCRMVR
jgi:hypothetical protein